MRKTVSNRRNRHSNRRKLHSHQRKAIPNRRKSVSQKTLTFDRRRSKPLGAKTVHQILSENGAETLLRSAEEKLAISFSPLTGEIVSVSVFEENTTVDGKNKTYAKIAFPASKLPRHQQQKAAAV